MDMADPSRAAVHAPRTRNRALDVLAGVAVVALLKWGEPFFVPLIVSIILSLALSPVVDLLQRVVRYRVVAATVVVAALLGAMGAAAWMWSDQAALVWQKVPDTMHTVARSLRRMARQPATPITEVKKAAADIESAAQEAGGAPSKPARSAAPAPAPSKSMWELLLAGGKSLGSVLSETVAVVFLVFFMLSSGTLFKRKLVVMSGERLTQRKLTVEMLDEMDRQVRRYLLVLFIANVLVGIGTFGVFRVAGLEYPGLWGLVAAVLHTIPYFGPALIAAASLIVAFVQFGDWGRAAVVALSSVIVATIVGQMFATWLASRQTRMNTTATFIGLLFFAWIWGFWGLLLGIPILAIAKTICEHHEDWKPVAELLGQ